VTGHLRALAAVLPGVRALDPHWIRGWMVPKESVNVRRRKEALAFSGNRIHPSLSLVVVLHHHSSYTHGERIVKGVLLPDSAIGLWLSSSRAKRVAAWRFELTSNQIKVSTCKCVTRHLAECCYLLHVACMTLPTQNVRAETEGTHCQR
jgi:hypothetical protein